MIQLFTDVSLGLFGGTRGGPAKVAVFASGMMGTISGSGVANVVTVGQFTIPLMIRFGYRRAFAAGVEATASMGGQIMPPVMGAVAFIMAETLGVEYAVIVKAAIIPAMLYFASAFWMVHLEAGKHGLVGMKRSEIPNAWKSLVARWYLVLPLAALVYMLFQGFTPLYAGSMGLALTVALILGASITLDCVTSLQNGADLLWIETEKPHIEQIAKMVDRIRKVIPNAKLAYNNSPSFNWTLNFRWQVYDAMKEAGKDVSNYNRAELMKAEYDDTPLAKEADERIRTFQADSAKRAGIFHHLITLPTYHTAALSTDNLAREYFGEQGMLGYVKNVQRAEIRQGIACVKHQNMAGSNIGDDHKEYFAGEAALKAGGVHNTMNQFG